MALKNNGTAVNAFHPNTHAIAAALKIISVPAVPGFVVTTKPPTKLAIGVAMLII